MHQLRPHIFLVDGLGAVVSTLATAFVLPAFQPWIGLPRPVLLGLAVPAALFAAYSLGSWQLGIGPGRGLSAIVYGNLAYCAVVVVVLAAFVGTVTPLGFGYFLGEIAVVVGIASLEARIVRLSREGR
ncbi:MAG: hypothetical protein AAF602_06720 [Myxococcota bacterium]